MFITQKRRDELAEQEAVRERYAAERAADERARAADYEARQAAQEADYQAKTKAGQDALRQMTPAEHLEAAIQAGATQAAQLHLLFAMTKSMVGGR